jgi:hypothetical protein
MIDIRTIDRKRYADLRETVRDHITVNSRIMACNREKFYRNEDGKKFIVGGVVLNKEMIKRCYYRHRPNRWEFFKLEDLVKNPEHLGAVEFVSTVAIFKLWDFSGIFTLTFDQEFNQGSDCSFSDLANIKEGDVVYAISKRIFPYYMSSDFEVKGERTLSLDEVVRLKNGDLAYSREELDRDFYNRNEINDICNRAYKKDICYESEFGEDPMSIIRFFLKKDDEFDNTYYLWLFRRLKKAYRKCPTKKTANMAAKYYKLWHNSQNWEGVSEQFKREDFYSWFPDLKGIVPEKSFN